MPRGAATHITTWIRPMKGVISAPMWVGAHVGVVWTVMVVVLREWLHFWHWKVRIVHDVAELGRTAHLDC